MLGLLRAYHHHKFPIFTSKIRTFTQHNTKWTSKNVRSAFVTYFQDKHHTLHPSSPVVPHSDPSLLFSNAGMNQFKPIFLGLTDPLSPLFHLKSAVNSQKCIRAGGKHNDLDDVGKDTYHHTFFEMLGTWSFNGAYSQSDAIDWAFTLLTHPNLYGLNPDRLYASYFGGDSVLGLVEDCDTRDAWLKHLPADRVLPFSGVPGDNFWEMGDTGPCGPCTEIHYDRIGSRNAAHLVNADDPNVLEIWNLVFMQYNRAVVGGDLTPLPALHIDTGMGLERLTSILQGTTSNYDTDIFIPILDAIHKEYKLPGNPTEQLPSYSFSEYQSTNDFVTTHGTQSTELQLEEKQRQQRDLAYRVIADHLRTASIAIADGTQLSSVGRGYVIRRVLRRALRYAQLLTKESNAIAGGASEVALSTPNAFESKLSRIVPIIVQQLGDVYPELKASEAKIIEVIGDEELSFATLLKRGLKFLEEKMAQLVADNKDDENNVLTVSGEDIFYLYDTLGFPVDLTELIVEEHNQNIGGSDEGGGKSFRLDLKGYEEAMLGQKERAASAYAQHKQSLLGLDGGSALTPSISALHKLKKDMVPATDDSAKFFLPSLNVNGKFAPDMNTSDSKLDSSTLLRVFTNEDGFLGNVTVEASRGVFGLLLDRTSFYAEGGGQVSDTGTITIVKEGEESTSLSVNVIDVQSHGQYILHTCVIVPPDLDSDTNDIHSAATDLLKSGSVCKLEVDISRRNRIVPNHTMTHVLNFVLREVLDSNEIDQKGSLVAAEKLRFDFSYHKALTIPVIEKIESRVREIIQQDLTVQSATVPLEKAKRLDGVRAVFGEQYPDPVRVVGIGLPRSIESMVDTTGANDNTDEGGVPMYSVEFCGGTHLASTGQAQDWVVLEETAIAKGVRRLVAVTGDAAFKAIRQGRVLVQRSDDLGNDINEFISSSHQHIDFVVPGDVDTELNSDLGRRLEELQDKVNQLKNSVEESEVSITVTHPLRKKIQLYQKALIGCRKKYVAAAVEVCIERLLQQSKTNSTCAVLKMAMPQSISCDAGVMKKVTQGVQSGNPPDFSFLVICPDQPSSKLKCFAAVSESAVNEYGFSAAKWVDAVTNSLGGKGGGKDTTAQGSVDINDIDTRSIHSTALEQAELYMQSRLK